MDLIIVYVSNGPGTMAPVRAIRNEKEKIIQNEEINFVNSVSMIDWFCSTSFDLLLCNPG